VADPPKKLGFTNQSQVKIQNFKNAVEKYVLVSF